MGYEYLMQPAQFKLNEQCCVITNGMESDSDVRKLLDEEFPSLLQTRNSLRFVACGRLTHH